MKTLAITVAYFSIGVLLGAFVSPIAPYRYKAQMFPAYSQRIGTNGRFENELFRADILHDSITNREYVVITNRKSGYTAMHTMGADTL